MISARQLFTFIQELLLSCQSHGRAARLCNPDPGEVQAEAGV